MYIANHSDKLNVVQLLGYNHAADRFVGGVAGGRAKRARNELRALSDY